MANSWQSDYAHLKGFVEKQPGIEISPESVVLPEDIRAEFYRLFDMVQISFIKGHFSEELAKGYLLSRHWLEVQRDVAKTLNLEAITLPAGSSWFFNDPLDGLMRGLFDTLFNLLKNKITPDVFEQTASKIVKDDFTKYFREGYQRWAILALIKLLLPDKLYSVPTQDFHEPSEAEGDPVPGSYIKEVPEATETNLISFEHDLMCSFLAPKIIIHSTKLDCFVSFLPDFYEPRWKARLLSSKQEWYRIADIKKEFGINKLWPDLVINMADDKADLVLAADYFQISRPDMIVDCREDGDWFQREGLGILKRHYDVLKPRLGSFVICREAVPEAALKELEAGKAVAAAGAEAQQVQNPDSTEQELKSAQALEASGTAVGNQANIHFLTSDFDMSSLGEIIDAMQASRQDMLSKSTAVEGVSGEDGKDTAQKGA
ncbi:MAG: hypothetical protein C4542_04430 [Dehalococcoidia bacterium]|nr:MAG: hypothetical protein C4542_04430 [Dehalococcoidia bacterium]